MISFCRLDVSKIEAYTNEKERSLSLNKEQMDKIRTVYG